MSAYYIVGEDQYTGGVTAVPASENIKNRYGFSVATEFYLSTNGPNGQEPYDWRPEKVLYARYNFLYDHEGGPCVQGTGQLLNGEYIYCGYNLDLTPPGTPGMGFEWQTSEKLDDVVGHEFDTIAVCLTQSDPVLSSGTEIVIPDLADYMKTRGDKNTTFTVRDTGEGLCTKAKELYDTLDLFVGTGKTALDNHYTQLLNAVSGPVEVYRLVK